YVILFLFYRYPHPRHLHSFPTRRSSDLNNSPATIGSVQYAFSVYPLNDIHLGCGVVVIGHDALSVARLLTMMNRSWMRRLFRKLDRKSTRLNSSHDQISYAVFCLKKKKN